MSKGRDGYGLQGLTVAIAADRETDIIRYTTDGSDPATFLPEYEPRPILSHDGRTLRAENSGPYEILNSDMEDLPALFDGSLDLPRLFTITVRGISDSRFPSAPADYRSMAYYDEEQGEAGCRKPRTVRLTPGVYIVAGRKVAVD